MDEKLIQFSVTVVDGQFFAPGMDSKLLGPCRAILSVPAEDIASAELRKKHYPLEVKFLKRRTRIFFEVRHDRVPEDHRACCWTWENGVLRLLRMRGKNPVSISPERHLGAYSLVEAILETPLGIEITGPEDARLLPAKVRIPSLERETDSLNEAYSVVLREFQPLRRSFVGNAFRSGYALHKGELMSLDLLRRQRFWETDNAVVTGTLREFLISNRFERMTRWFEEYIEPTTFLVLSWDVRNKNPGLTARAVDRAVNRLINEYRETWEFPTAPTFDADEIAELEGA